MLLPRERYRMARSLFWIGLIVVFSGIYAVAGARAAVAQLRPAQNPANYRTLAPGVEITIPSDRQEADTFSTHNIVEIVSGHPEVKWKPKLAPESQTLTEKSTQTMFHHNIWYLEFTFKPVRMMYVDVPQPSGKMQRKLIWYMIYHVKNTGGHLKPTVQPDGTYVVSRVNHPVRCMPLFVLESQEYKKAYPDRIIPAAVLAIQRKEDPNRRLLNSAEISSRPIGVSTSKVDQSVWGVATWEGIDPRVDFFSVCIEGLTNAYKWADKPDAFKPGDLPGTGRVLMQKMLLLNFWRPGEEYLESERIIRYGIPGKVDYSWIYR